VQIAKEEGSEVIIIQETGRSIIWIPGEEGENNEKEKKVWEQKEIYIYIDNDLTQEKREMQRKLREIARGKRANGRRTRVGYRRIEIEGEMYIWNEGENRIVKKRNFRRTIEEKG